jgi:hypothetical protein
MSPCRALRIYQTHSRERYAAGDADQLPFSNRQDLANRFATAGIDVPDSAFYTSAMATADFLRRQEGKKPMWSGKAR